MLPDPSTLGAVLGAVLCAVLGANPILFIIDSSGLICSHRHGQEHGFGMVWYDQEREEALKLVSTLLEQKENRAKNAINAMSSCACTCLY